MCVHAPPVPIVPGEGGHCVASASPCRLLAWTWTNTALARLASCSRLLRSAALAEGSWLSSVLPMHPGLLRPPPRSPPSAVAPFPRPGSSVLCRHRSLSRSAHSVDVSHRLAHRAACLSHPDPHPLAAASLASRASQRRCWPALHPYRSFGDYKPSASNAPNDAFDHHGAFLPPIPISRFSHPTTTRPPTPTPSSSSPPPTSSPFTLDQAAHPL